MMRLIATALALALAVPALAATPPRPAADTAMDANRKPDAMVAFAGIRPGMTVADIIPGNGYFTRVFAAAVGPQGKVVAVIPADAASHYVEGTKAINAMAADPAYGNIVVAPGFAGLAGTVDIAWTAQNYHDLHNAPPGTVAGFNTAVFAALKPGGLYVIEDHAAAAGAPADVTKTLHRIDPATVKAEVTAAGFVFVDASTVLANPADPHSAIVFDPTVRGHTDQFVYRFRKP